MARPMVTGSDLISAGLTPDRDFSQLLAYARKLHLAGLDREAALRQTLAYARKLSKSIKRRLSIRSAFFYGVFYSRWKFTTRPANTMETMLSSLMRMLIAGPEVSLKGSPTVSPTTPALWQSEPLPPK